MQTSYIYSASRANTLSEALLTETDIDRLLVASPGEDLHSALKETYLAPYLLQTGEDFRLAIEKQLIEAKHLIAQIAPKKEMLQILWIQYDIHNLRVIAKGTQAQLGYEQLEAHLSSRGIYEPRYLYEMATSQSLNRLQQDWQVVYDDAVRALAADNIGAVDGVFDQLFFATILRLAETAQDAFMKRYVKALIDLHNLKSRLRTVTYPDIDFAADYISGGNFAKAEIETKEQVLAAYQSLGGESFWREAIDFYTNSKNTTQLDARADDYLLTMAREAGYDMFSSAALVLYYLRCRQAAANIRTITVGRDGGMSEALIRPNLRLAYVKQ